MDVAINRQLIAANDVRIWMFGRLVNLIEINYKEGQDVTPTKVLGNRKDVGYTRGNYKAEGNVVMMQEDIFALQAAGGGSILNLKGDIVVTYMINGIAIKETLVGVVFKERGTDAKAGTGDSLRYNIPFYAVDLKVAK